MSTCQQRPHQPEFRLASTSNNEGWVGNSGSRIAKASSLPPTTVFTTGNLRERQKSSIVYPPAAYVARRYCSARSEPMIPGPILFIMYENVIRVSGCMTMSDPPHPPQKQMRSSGM